METIIESPHFTVNDLLKEYILKKTKKLTKLDERLIKCHVLLKLDRSSTEENKICEIKADGPLKKLFASCQGLTFEDTITQTIHAIEKQLRAKKAKPRRDGKKLEIENESEEEAL